MRVALSPVMCHSSELNVLLPCRCGFDYIYERKFSVVGFCSGIIAGLIGITPASGLERQRLSQVRPNPFSAIQGGVIN